MEDGIEGEELPELSPAPEESEEDKMPEMVPVLDHAHAPHGHGGGVPWLDIIVGLSAIFISVVSLVVSIGHGKTMEKMVDQNQKMVVASTLPLLTMGYYIDGSNRADKIRLSVENDGVGPAIVERFEIRYKGVAQTTDMLFKNCCAPFLDKDGLFHGGYVHISGSILPAREKKDIITISPKGSDNRLSLAFEKSMNNDLSIHACYCSVLEECWETDFDSSKRPQPVKECKVAPNEKLW
ncbi:MAG: hypothetical protein ACLQGT_07310 [Terracidiphilus sp.]